MTSRARTLARQRDLALRKATARVLELCVASHVKFANAFLALGARDLALDEMVSARRARKRRERLAA